MIASDPLVVERSKLNTQARLVQLGTVKVPEKLLPLLTFCIPLPLFSKELFVEEVAGVVPVSEDALLLGASARISCAIAS
jgi:hypothetical protein